MTGPVRLTADEAADARDLLASWAAHRADLPVAPFTCAAPMDAPAYPSAVIWPASTGRDQLVATEAHCRLASIVHLNVASIHANRARSVRHLTPGAERVEESRAADRCRIALEIDAVRRTYTDRLLSGGRA